MLLDFKSLYVSRVSFIHEALVVVFSIRFQLALSPYHATGLTMLFITDPTSASVEPAGNIVNQTGACGWLVSDTARKSDPGCSAGEPCCKESRTHFFRVSLHRDGFLACLK